MGKRWLVIITDVGRSWWLSLTDIAFYRVATHLPTRFFITYLLISYAVLATFSTVFMVLFRLPVWQQTTLTFLDGVVAQLPANWTISYANQQLTTLPNLPLNLADPTTTNASPSMWLATIQTQVDLPPASPTALLMMGGRQFTLHSPDSPHSLSYADIWGDTTWRFTSSDWPARRAQWQTMWTRAAPLLLGLYWWGSSLGVLLIRLPLLLLYSWLGYSWLRWWWRPAPRYWATFRMGLVLMVVAETVARLLHVLYPHQAWLGFWMIWLILWLCISFFARHIRVTPINLTN